MLATPYAFNYDTMLLGAAIAFMVADRIKHGFAPFEISAIALLWITPLVSREVTALLHVPLALLVQTFLLALLLQRALRDTRQPTSFAHAV